MNGTVGFDEDIEGLFRQDDRDCMLANSFPPFDLADWESVRSAAQRIAERLEAGDMPPDGPWPPERVQLFKAWITEGAPKRRGNGYAAFFVDLDSYTEYWREYRPETNGRFMAPIRQVIFPRLLPLWRNYVLAGPQDKPRFQQDLITVLNEPAVSQAVTLIDGLLLELVGQHFSGADGLDRKAAIEAQLLFGKDELPLDPARDARIPTGDPRKPFAKFHRMDGAIMWFNWAAHIECSVLLLGEGATGHGIRTAQLAGICGGSSMDFTFRDNRLPTRPEYRRNDATEREIRRKTETIATSWTQAVDECHELFGIAAHNFLPNKFFTEGVARIF
jgi:hypothetical protein